jgi:hypothetical protein
MIDLAQILGNYEPWYRARFGDIKQPKHPSRANRSASRSSKDFRKIRGSTVKKDEEASWKA